MIKIKLVSFGFKYGQPHSNYYFDVGFIKNPAREKGWTFFSAINDDIRKYIMEQDQAKRFIEMVVPLIELLFEIDQRQIFAFGCSAGRHRSPVIVETIAECLRERGIESNVEHRDLD